MLLLAVAFGGAFGAVARYGVSGLFQGPAGAAFPWGTFVVNALGSVLLGFTLRWLESIAASPELRALLTIGFLGAFTTFSTFSWEAVRLIQDREWVRAASYTFGSVAIGIGGVVAGIMLATYLRTAR